MTAPGPKPISQSRSTILCSRDRHDGSAAVKHELDCLVYGPLFSGWARKYGSVLDRACGWTVRSLIPAGLGRLRGREASA